MIQIKAKQQNVSFEKNVERAGICRPSCVFYILFWENDFDLENFLYFCGKIKHK